MSSLSLEAYNRSVLDWDRLRRYARRVAAETPLPLAAPLTYTRTVRTVRTEHRPGGFLGLGKPRAVHTPQNTEVEETAVGPHWLLDHRYWHHFETKPRAYTESTRESYYLVLLPDGALKSVTVSQIEVLSISTSPSYISHSQEQHTVRDPDDAEIRRLDFALRPFDRTFRNGPLQIQVISNRDPGTRLRRHAKGVGVNIALKTILEGHSPAPS